MPFDTLTFRYPWREYQERVLEAIDHHLSDERLHVVAAPGAGKTTLGLEIFRRLRKRALVLSPTRVIRDQWIRRLDDFRPVGEGGPLDWVSTDIGNPATLTSITYQALLSRVKQDAEKGDAPFEEDPPPANDREVQGLIATLKAEDIQVIIMDEAHHLRAQWWWAIDRVCKVIPGLVLVSLTATPPYDAEEHAWSKYESLCGPIDEEISVPELVKAGTLCPHQDFVWMAALSPTESQRLRDYDERVETLSSRLFGDATFESLVLAHRWIDGTFPEQEVIHNPHLALAILAFAKAKGAILPKGLRTVLDLSPSDIPELDRQRWQVLVEGVLYSNTFEHSAAHAEYVAQLEKELRAVELLRHREVSLIRSRRMERSLSLSSAKLESCVAIHELEQSERGDDLRQVVLTDFIRDEDLSFDADPSLLTLGAWPVFRALALASKEPEAIALLTGRLSVVPAGVVQRLAEYVDPERFTFSELDPSQPFQRVEGPLAELTRAMTQLLNAGHIKTLVGTRALLGEGWDAPVVNSLILASGVGSFMLTNQMRGRAIRMDKGVPAKVSSIWHLAAIDTRLFSGCRDLDNLERRFDTFVGLSQKGTSIESGFDRIEVTSLSAFDSIAQLRAGIVIQNQVMARRFRALGKVASGWREAVTLDDAARVLPSVKAPRAERIRRFHVRNTVSFLLSQVGLGVVLGASLMVSGEKGGELGTMLMLAGVGAFLGLLYNAKKSFRLARVLLFHLPVDGSLKEIGKALMHALCEVGWIEASPDRLKVVSTRLEDGTYSIALMGATFYESSLFAECMRESLSPIETPRYLLIREGGWLGWWRRDYHPVPMRFGVKKELAQVFAKAWNRWVCPGELIYTRGDEGRRVLLKARMRAFSSAFASEAKRQDRWVSGE